MFARSDPQGFSRAAITSAHASGLAASDDAGLAEKTADPSGSSMATRWPSGDHADDLERAERLAPHADPNGDRRPARHGKTTLSRRLARLRDATLVRVDSIEQALTTDLDLEHPGTTGYAIAYAVAADQLRLGRSVVADLVNPLPQTRVALRQIAGAGGRRDLTDPPGLLRCHRTSSPDRGPPRPDIPGMYSPTWRDVTERLFVAWPEARVIDTAGRTPEQVFRVLRDGP